VAVRPGTTYRCAHCTQLVPFDGATRVPDAVLRRCQGGCDWREMGPTAPEVWEAAAADGPVGPDGLPVS
jgi:hypothetical protein